MTGLRLVLAGAAVNNGNRGVEALGCSIADAVERDAPGGILSILDDGWGVRPDSSGRYLRCAVEYVGVRRSRRWYRPESWAQVSAAQTILPPANAVARRFSSADAVLDLSAGDSFTDLYGLERLKTVTAPKQAALRAGRPLVLLPQTYGPFENSQARNLAKRIIGSATLAYARDPRSYERLLDLAGPDPDTTRLRSGVDVAFALQPRRPANQIAERVESLGDDLTAGVNVSGLLQSQASLDRYGMPGSYLDTMTLLVRELVAEGARVVLIPHVHTPGGSGESDIAAINRVRANLSKAESERTAVIPPSLDAAEVKWCISQVDWFVGSRMHSTIAALSTLTPAVGYAYSDKTLGVFQTCGVGDQVVDAREVTGAAAVDRMTGAFRARALVRQVLEDRISPTLDSSRTQLRDIFRMLGSEEQPNEAGVSR